MYPAGHIVSGEKRVRGRGWRRGRGHGREGAVAGLVNTTAKLDLNDTNDDIPPDLIDPCKVFVGNLRPSVGEKTLHEALSYYANVEKVVIIKDKQSGRSKGFGFVTVAESDDVDKLLGLRLADRYLSGQKMTIRKAKKRICLPGHSDYVRCPLPLRDYDLSLPDPDLPSIHMLVDDVLYKILEYLPMKDVVRSEQVCRRWQVLIHGMFTKVYKLELAPSKLGLSTPITRSIISKLLILSGPTLKELKLLNIAHASRGNIMKIVGQLCPVLESLDVSMAYGLSFSNITELCSMCRHLKTFIAENCPDFNEKALHQLLRSYPALERLHISGCSVNGRSFNMLPNTITELNISFCLDITEKGKNKGPLYHIGERCPNLHTLEMEKCRVSKEVLDHIGTKCPGLTRLSVFIVEPEAFQALKNFKNLKDLTVDSVFLDLHLLIQNMPALERLFVDSRLSSGGNCEFSFMKDLKYIKLCHIEMTPESILTLAKCTKLEEVYLQNCGEFNQEVLVDLLRGCSSLKRIHCPNVKFNLEFIKSVNKIMESRSGKLLIEVRTDYLTPKELLEAQYDSSKIEFDPICGYPFLYDPDDIDDADSLYSARSLEDYWLIGFDGFDSDHSLPDALCYDDHLDFLRHPFLMNGFGYESEDDSDPSN